MARRFVRGIATAFMVALLATCASPKESTPLPTPLPPTATPVLPATLALPTETPPPTNTPVPPTSTPVPPTVTVAPPTATPEPTATSTPAGVAGVDYPLRIMAMGDVLTEGICDKANDPQACQPSGPLRPLQAGLDACGASASKYSPHAVGYRAFLRDLLTAEGIQMEYVGSVQVTEGLYHEGHTNWTIGDLDYCVREGDCLEEARPDIILLHIGMNDAAMALPTEQMLADLVTLLDHIYSKMPSTTVIVAQLVRVSAIMPAFYSTDTHLLNDLMAPYNDGIPAIVEEMRGSDRRIYCADMSIVAPNESEFDGPEYAYPQSPIYQRMAQVWFEKIVEIVRTQ